MMSGGVRDVEIPVCNVDLSTMTSCVHDLVTFWASHADLSMNCTNSVKPPRGLLEVESGCMVWVQGCRGSVLGFMEVSFHRWGASDTSPTRR